MPLLLGPLDWNAIDLVVFDVDGTLYRQSPLRARMAVDLIAASARSGSLRTVRVLRAFRRCREALGAEEGAGFAARQFEAVASQCGCSAGEVQSLVSDWIERRPLAHLPSCRHPGIDGVFEALRRAGKTIAVLSDYPVPAKLAALGLAADIVVSADDDDVARLKPHPAGLAKVLRLSRADISRSLMIGDRADRDGAAARRIGMRALILSQRPLPDFDTFRSYSDEVFRHLLERREKPATDALCS